MNTVRKVSDVKSGALSVIEGDLRKIEQKLVGALIKNKLTIGIAESFTGGLLASRIVDVAGSSACFEMGIITYSNRSKIEFLGVKERTIERFGAVSAECAHEMAEGVRRLAGADIGVSTTGIAGPSGGTREKPVGTAYIGISVSGSHFVEQYLFNMERNVNRLLAVCEAFTGVWRLLENEYGNKGRKYDS
jgi:nicotinamide-nucleotide amidase